MAKLLYQGHGSYRITLRDGRVIYIDPYVGEGYDLAADFIFVTHQHHDHNAIDLITQKPGCRIISNVEALAGGRHQSFDLGGGLLAEAVEASNANHNPAECVGFILTVDGLALYASGDTSRTGQMEQFAARQLDYALFPCDGIYNMDVEEAARCAALVGAKHSIPIHLKPGELFDRERAEQFAVENRLIVEPGEEIEL